MNSIIPLMVIVAPAPVLTLPTNVLPLAPVDLKGKSTLTPDNRKTRAAVLLHGLHLWPIRQDKISRPEPHEWQKPRGDLVRTLAPDFDVFGFCYAQTTPIDAVAHAAQLRNLVDELKRTGYKDIVLIGHSAGGVVSRLFAERYPTAGVTKVIQVCAPNQGSDLANISVGYPKIHTAFIRSMSPELRTESLVRNAAKIPDGLQFVSVVVKLPGFAGDGLLSPETQWPEDLQKQGTPAARTVTHHNDGMKTAGSVRVIAELAREKLVRWTPEQVEQARRVLVGEAADRPGSQSRRK
jgi:pimeloyl-ACP methyl ester carboxylesterase